MRKSCLASFILIFLLSFNVSFAEVLSPTPSPKVNYELPYPGLLPDNPLYFLRIIRDRTVDFLISDPLKKSQFHLLQADKRLNAGIYLFNKGKVSMSISTISKGENYFGQAIENAKEAQKEGVEIQEMTRRLINSAKKHQEELDSLGKKAPQDFKTNFRSLQKRASVFEGEAKSLGLKR